ncbi:RHS repeat-associated core domain-containing protein [Chryseobacterium sp. KCF3-3]|uniref:RHS repeat-associated core domain-containing protein n=1 Tax=Chryseobacterium sp. KCF3-3 TaxID=3231511 RepID=UPI0038B3F208
MFFRDASGNAAIDRTTDYYPFGLEFGGDLNIAGSMSPNYTYTSQGKEKQMETGWNDYGARMYMSDIGRWGVVDPLAEISRRWSTYAYAYNNPIRFTDPDGMQNKDVILSGDLKDKAFEQLPRSRTNPFVWNLYYKFSIYYL